MTKLKGKVFFFLYLALTVGWAACAQAGGAVEKSVLIVLPYSHEFQATQQLIKGIKDGLGGQGRYKINYAFEFLELHLIKGDEDYLRNAADFFRKKYSRFKPDIVITGAILSRFMMAHGTDMFPGAPILVPWRSDAPIPDEVKQHCYVVSATIKYAGGIDMIRKLQPDVRKVLVVLGASDQERRVASLLSEEARKIKAWPELEFLNDLPKRDMLEKVRAAKPGTAILYLSWVKDISGESSQPFLVAQEVCKEANVPVYAVEKQFLGTGVVGGDLFSFELFGQAGAAKALDVLDGSARLGEENMTSVSEPVFDWRALRRFGIPESNLPPGSRVEFREPSLWSQYKEFVLAGLALVLLESALIVALVMNRARRRKVEAELVNLNASLEKIVFKKTHKLRKANAALSQAKFDLEQMNRQLDLNSRTDCLTGQFNRRHMDEVLMSEFARYVRGGETFSIVLCDIDFFKNVNDLHGHDAGDFILRMFGAELGRSVRPYDTVARWGGEEFLLFLPRTQKDEATLFAERIRARIEAGKFEYQGNVLQVTATFGVAAISPGDGLDDVMKRADNALYEGKRTGRNRVVSGGGGVASETRPVTRRHSFDSLTPRRRPPG